YGVWGLALYPAGRQWGLDWDGLTRAISSALPAGARAARSLRAEVVRALLPLALTVGGPSAAGEEGSEPEPSPGDEVYEALLDRRAWSEEVCQAVRDAAPATKAFKLEQARALIAAFFAAHGFVAKGKRLLSADKQVRATIGARSLRIDLGGPGQWRKPPSLQGRELYLKDFARQLIALAEV
ncbi:MAG TPA: hypothetical protein DEA08_19075, partial [Planctomycetes bacterium]|nr:hypothetical protein [Planctomycetota bacterium]